MTKLNVRPTRVELRNLQRKFHIAKRGHTLLKEKQDALVARFLKLMEEARQKRKTLDVAFAEVYHHYQLASLLNDDGILQEVLNHSQDTLEVDIQLDTIFGIHVPKMKTQSQTESQPFTSGFIALRDLDYISSKTQELQKLIVAVAEIEKQCQLLASEIVLTKRRVNSLEYRTIPDLEETISYITMKIEDNERQQISKLLNMQESR